MRFGQVVAAGLAACFALSGVFVAGAARAEETIKVGLIDPMSGAFAASGRLGEQHFRFGIDRANNGVLAGTGMKLELVILDNEVSPEKSLVMLRKAIDDGVHFITQGNGSAVAYALTDAVAKNNKRDPDRAVLYLNYAAVDPSLTNEKCNWWHFRFDADSDMKMHALTDYLVSLKDVHKVYVFNQDYSFGQAVERGALEMLKDRRPDLQVIGTERVPLGKVKDFAPYIAKMQTSGADAVVTGNWGVDLSLLVKAAADSGFKGRFFTYYLGSRDIVSQIGPAGKGAALISTYYNNMEYGNLEALAADFEKKYDQIFSSWTAVNEMEVLGAAIKKAGSSDPLKVGKALDGMQWKNPMGTVTMRADNHQLLQPMFISVLDSGTKHVFPDVNMGFREISRIEPEQTKMATTCKFPNAPR
jgi:branched-chain amino acid transport system substrate-binding protein